MHYFRIETRKLLFWTVLTLSSACAMAQQVVKGRVVDEQGEPIPFASIGIPNSYVGTISELDGAFELKIPRELMRDSISFSSIGYISASLSVKQGLSEFQKVVLADDIRRLAEVVVESRKIKPKVKKSGKVHQLNGRFMSDVDYSGSAMAQLVESPFDTTQIQWVNLGYFNKIEDLQLRVKFHEVDELGQPGDLLVDKEMIVDLYEFDGSHKMRFDEFIYVTDKNFFVVFEPLILKKNRVDLFATLSIAMKKTPELVKIKNGELLIDNNELDINFFQFKVSQKMKGNTFYRASSFDKWRESEELSMVAGISDINEDLGFTVARVETEFAKSTTSVDVYEHKQGFSYATVADYLRRVGGLRVEGKGEDVKVWVRGGVSSFLYSNEPIFVIDGVNVGRGYRRTIGLSPNQIRSVEVLRGPVQTVKWGEDGNNGVVVIKTVNSQ